MTYKAQQAAFDAECETHTSDSLADFRTPADPEAGWARRNPGRALLFLFVSPRECGAAEELMAL